MKYKNETPKALNGDLLFKGASCKLRCGEKCSITLINDKVHIQVHRNNTSGGEYQTSVNFDGYWEYNKSPNEYDIMGLWEAPIVQAKDAINPDHYKVGGMQPWEYLKMKLTPEALKGFYLGNVIKYCSRADHKGKVEDFKKARWYLDKIIEDMEAITLKVSNPEREIIIHKNNKE